MPSKRISQKNLRILMLSASYLPDFSGVATHVANLVHGIIRSNRNFKVCLVTTRQPGDFGEVFQDNGGLSIWKLQQEEKEPPVFSGREAPFAKVSDLILKDQSRFNPSIIHAHDFQSIAIGATLKAAFSIPLVATVHRAPIPWRNEVHRECSKDCFLHAIHHYRFADHLVVPSQISKDVLISHGFEKDSITIIRHGLGKKYLSSICNHLELLEDIKVRSEDELILCPARGDYHKDPITFVRAAVKIKKLFPKRKFKFLITCDKKDSEYHSIQNEGKLGGLVIDDDLILKTFDYLQMPTLYRRALFCVIPSRRESFGQSVIESLIYKRPVIVANQPALNEIITHKKNGLLFTDGNVNELVEQMKVLLENSALSGKLAANGLKSVDQKFTIEKMVPQYVSLYSKVLSEQKN